jgi:hypothetical protein
MNNSNEQENIEELNEFRSTTTTANFAAVRTAYYKAFYLSIIYILSDHIIKIKFTVLTFFIIRFIAYFTGMSNVLFGTGLIRLFIYLIIFSINYIIATIFVDRINKIFLSIGKSFFSVMKYDLKFIFYFIRITQFCFLIRYYAPFTSYTLSCIAVLLAIKGYKEYMELPITVLMIFILLIHSYELLMSPFNPAKSIDMNYNIYQKYCNIRDIQDEKIPVKLKMRERFSPPNCFLYVVTASLSEKLFFLKRVITDKYLSITWIDYKEYLQISNIYHKNIFDYVNPKTSIFVNKSEIINK